MQQRRSFHCMQKPTIFGRKAASESNGVRLDPANMAMGHLIFGVNG